MESEKMEVSNGWSCPPKAEPKSKTKFRCSKLQQVFGSCLRPGNVIEIWGEAGTGKTQFCLDLALQTTDYSTNGRVLYITTDRNFPITRMTQLVEHTELSIDNLDRIIVTCLYDSAALLAVLENSIPDFCGAFKLELLVVDSIVGALRSEYEQDKRDERAHAVHFLGNLLHQIARKYSIPILVTNQATAVIDQPQENFGRNILPCLGVSWSSYVHTRIFLEKTGMTVQSEQLHTSKKIKVETSVRNAVVDFSPVLPNCTQTFVVDNAGVRAITIQK